MQAHVLQTVRQLCRKHGIAAVYVSHDLAVVASLAHRVAVMYAGRVVELGPTAEVLHAPLHPYTTALIRAVPDIASRSRIEGIPGQAPEPGRRQSGCSFAPRCGLATPQCREAVPVLADSVPGHAVRCIRAGQSAPAAAVPVAVSTGRETVAAPVLHVAGLVARYGTTQILHDVSFDVPERSCVALVGESGSGKTTLARTIGGCMPRSMASSPIAVRPFRSGRVTEAARCVGGSNTSSRIPTRRSIPAAASASPSPSLCRPSRACRGQSCGGASPRRWTRFRYRQARSIAVRMKCPVDSFSVPPIARALVVSPDLLICDEVTSALDASVQAVIVALLGYLQRERGLSMLFITHNLALIRGIAQSVVVLQSGRVIEAGSTDRVLGAPRADETRRLLADVPRFTAV